MSGAIVRTTTVPWGYGVLCTEHNLDLRTFKVKANAQTAADAHNTTRHGDDLAGTEACS